MLPKLFWPTMRKKLFWWSRKTFVILGWKPRICQIFEITRTIYSNSERSEEFLVQVNIFQKHSFLNQLTRNMTTDCTLNYHFSTWKFLSQNMSRTCWEHVAYINCFECQNKNKKQFWYTPCSWYVLDMFWAWNFHVLNW